MNQAEQQVFELLARPLIEFLNNHGTPHDSIIITTDSAEMLQGVCAFKTDDYVKG